MCGSSLTEFAKLLQAAGEHHVVEGKGPLVKAVRLDGEEWDKAESARQGGAEERRSFISW